MKHSTLRWSSLGVFAALLFALAACSDDGPNMRDPGGGPVPDSSSQGGPDPDAGGDVEDDADIGPEACELESRTSDFEDQPCCFTDQDCQDSNAPNADLMVCYSAACTPNGEGQCRIPPQGVNDCWTDADCEEGQVCNDAYIGTCSDPIAYISELIGTCQTPN